MWVNRWGLMFGRLTLILVMASLRLLVAVMVVLVVVVVVVLLLHIVEQGGGGGWHKAVVLVCLPLAGPIGLSPLQIPTLCGSARVLVVSMEGGRGGGTQLQPMYYCVCDPGTAGDT